MIFLGEYPGPAPVGRHVADLHVEGVVGSRGASCFRVVTQRLEVREASVSIWLARKPAQRHAVVFLIDLRASVMAVMISRHDGDSARPQVRIQDDIARFSSGKDDASYHILWELSWMYGLLFMIMLDVPEDPDIAGVLSQWITGQFPPLLSSPRFLILIFLRHPDRIEKEFVVVA